MKGKFFNVTKTKKSFIITAIFLIAALSTYAIAMIVNIEKGNEKESGNNIISKWLGSKKLRKFDLDQFKNPNSFYWPGYFWVWNDTLTKSKISNQLNDMSENGALSLCPLPIPKEFRPVNMPTLLTPDYMSSSYLDLFRYVIEQCQELNMKAYLYDEGGWPSGSCLGRVVEQNPLLIRQSLTRQILTPEKGNKISIPYNCVSAFLYKGDKKIKQLTCGTTEVIDIEGARIMIFEVKKEGTYPDLLNPESTREFIRLTHEEYKKVVGAYFGNTIQMTFTDEAQAANPGWTNDLAEDFKEKYFYDLRNELPSIFEGDSENDKKVRIDYFNWWSQRHADAYYGEIQAWCHENNLLSSGHLNGEDATEFARTYGYGHPLRALRRMDVPGVDVIWRQIWPGSNNHHFPKYASTVSHQAGTPWALTESFAVYGSGLTPDQMKWISDYQYVRGINLMVMSNYPLSQKDWFLGHIRPMSGLGDPLWQYMDNYHGYIGRLSYLLSIGKPAIKTAVYYPIRDIWAGGSELDLVCSLNDELVNVLLENQIDFDFIDDDVLESESTSIVNGNIIVGPMEYNTICVSHNQYMPEKSVRKLEQFINTGGKVFWINNATIGLNPVGIVESAISQLPSYLTPTIDLKVANNKIRVCKRNLFNSSAIYFVTNEDTCETSCVLQFDETLAIFQLDPETGKIWIPSKAIRTPKGWEIALNLKFAGSCVFIFTDEHYPTVSEPAMADSVLQTIPNAWTCHKTKSFELSNHGIEIRKFASEPLKDIALGDWRQTFEDIYSGDVEYVVKFKSTEFIKKNAKVIDLGDVRYACQVSLNGESIGEKIWEPFIFDIKGKIKEGDNVLKVTVTNTLANQYAYTQVLQRWNKNQLGPYHSRQLEFEKESVTSGLYGPVTIK